jgi:hypothetical protein
VGEADDPSRVDDECMSDTSTVTSATSGDGNAPFAGDGGRRAGGWPAIVAAACLYELVAKALNAIFEATIIPSLGAFLERFSPRTLGRLVPSWAPILGLLGFGFVLNVLVAVRAGLKRGPARLPLRER